MKQSWKIPAICGGLIAIFNIFVFVLPIHRTAVLWISDAVVVLAIAAQWPISNLAMKKGATVTSKVYGWPLMSVGLRWLGMIVACAIAFILLSSVIITFPIWLPIIVYAVLIGAMGIGLIAADSTRNYVEEQDFRQGERTVFMRKLYAEMNAFKRTVSDREMVIQLNKITEAVRFSDPASSQDVFEKESELYNIFGEIKEKVKANDASAVKAKCEEFREQLEIRNSMCKFAKRGKA